MATTTIAGTSRRRVTKGREGLTLDTQSSFDRQDLTDIGSAQVGAVIPQRVESFGFTERRRTVVPMTTLDTGTDDLLAVIDDGVATLTMNRPERRNAMSREMNESLARVLADVEVADDVGCVVLTGAGGAFCAGGDVKGMATGGDAGAGPPTSYDARRPPTAAQPAGAQPAAVRDAEADDCRAARGRGGRRTVAGTGVRPPLRRRPVPC